MVAQRFSRQFMLLHTFVFVWYMAVMIGTMIPAGYVEAKRMTIASFGPRITTSFHPLKRPSTPLFPLSTSSLKRRANKDENRQRMVSPEDIARNFISSKLSLPASQFRITDAYKSISNVHHVYLTQTINGVDIVNADANVNILEDGRVISYGTSIDGLVAFQPLTDTHNSPESHNLLHLKRRDADPFATEFVISPEDAVRKFLAFLNHPSASVSFSSTPFTPPASVLSLLPSDTWLDGSTSSTVNLQRSQDKDMVVFHVPEVIRPVQVKKAFIRVEKQRIRPAWDVRVDLGENWFHAHVDAENGEVLQLHDWVSDAVGPSVHTTAVVPPNETVNQIPSAPQAKFATQKPSIQPLKSTMSKSDPYYHRRPVPSWYRVVPLPTNNPDNGPRMLLTETHDRFATPFGWRGNPFAKPNDDPAYAGTEGNNAHAQVGTGGWTDYHLAPRPNATVWGAILDADYDSSLPPKQDANAGVVNAFYWVNFMHDLTYHLGLTDVAGAFQDVNIKSNKQNTANDAVLVNCQSPDGENNSNFASPPDGQRGRLRLYLFKGVDGKWRDSSLENDIIFHEY